MNEIKAGTIGIEFVDTANSDTREQTKIVLSGNTAIPMTQEYANANLDPYKFSLKNTGDIDLDYIVYLVIDSSNFGTEDQTVFLEITYNNKLVSYGLLNPYTPATEADKVKAELMSGTLNAGETIDYDDLRIYLNENTIIEQYEGKSLEAHLIVEAKQSVKKPTISVGDTIAIDNNNYLVTASLGNNQYKLASTKQMLSWSFTQSSYYNFSIPSSLKPVVAESSIQCGSTTYCTPSFIADLSEVEYTIVS